MSVELSARFLEAAGYDVYSPQRESDEWRYWPDRKSVGLSGSEPVPDLAAEDRLGQVESVIADQWPLYEVTQVIQAEGRKGVLYQVQIRESWSYMGEEFHGSGETLNEALMRAFIQARGLTLPEDE